MVSRKHSLIGSITNQGGHAAESKLNASGASIGNPREAGSGGILQDGNGRWIGSSCLNIGLATAMAVDLRAVPLGAWLWLVLGSLQARLRGRLGKAL